MTNKLVTETTLNSEKQDMTGAPAYFLSLTIENVRCFGPKQTLDLCNGNGRPAPWTIILGNNGVGKTTLLLSLASLAPVMSALTFNRRYVEPYGTHLGMKSLFKYLAGGKASRISVNFMSDTRLTDDGGGIVRENFNVATDGRTTSSLLMPFDDIGDLMCVGYGASRRMGDTSLSEKGGDDPFSSLQKDNAELINAEEWLLQADYAAHAAKNVSARRQAGNRRDEIKDVLVSLLPEVTDIRFIQLTEKQQKPGVEVETPYGWVSLKDLSLGYKTLIAWMVDFASRMFERYPNSPNPLAEPAVVLVDEIDLHLHPKWQRTLMGYLSERFPNTQFIATAHSPLVVQAAQDANIVLLRREGDHVIIENNVEAVRNWRVDQILTSDLFGLESARSPETDKLLAERTKLLSKAKLTKKDRERLNELEDEIGSLPTGETPDEIEAMDVIRRAAERLKAEGY
jgi:predicted ATP-binding protein involved in virulence